ncbi:MAG: DUF5671 domain-containing protein [Microbacteriaceae bacterium]
MTISSAPRENSVGQTVRRFIVFTLLITLVSIATVGVSGLLARVLDFEGTLGKYGEYELATSLAFAVIAGPLAAGLWWIEWRLLTDRAERDSALWGFYLAAMSTAALVVGASSLASTLSSLIASDWEPSAGGAAIAWLAVWVWHRWMSRHATKAPTRLVGGARILGYAFGLAIGIGGAVVAIAALIDHALNVTEVDIYSVGIGAWWITILQGIVWALVGAVVWWLHWLLDGGSKLRTGFSTVMIVIVTGLGATALNIGGLSVAVYTVLQLIFSADPVGITLAPLGTAIGSALMGALLWAYYRTQVRQASVAARFGTQLVSSGVALAAAASGVGVVINALLAELVTNVSVTGSDSRSLLFGGLSALIIGGPLWWLLWKPLAPIADDQRRDTSRKVYLISIFGVSALVAIITLLVIGFQIFTFALTSVTGSSLLENIRGSLGLLIATALVATYHFVMWRRDVARAPAVQGVHTITRVVLVASGDSDAAVATVRELTGAAVTVWRRADAAPLPDAVELSTALDGVTGARVLVIAESGGVRVIPLEN